MFRRRPQEDPGEDEFFDGDVASAWRARGFSPGGRIDFRRDYETLPELVRRQLIPCWRKSEPAGN